MVKIETAKGVISISPEVFTNIAGDAATRCFGVKGMAGKAKESGIYQLLRRESMSKGVFVTFNEDALCECVATVCERCTVVNLVVGVSGDDNLTLNLGDCECAVNRCADCVVIGYILVATHYLNRYNSVRA